MSLDDFRRLIRDEDLQLHMTRSNGTCARCNYCDDIVLGNGSDGLLVTESWRHLMDCSFAQPFLGLDPFIPPSRACLIRFLPFMTFDSNGADSARCRGCGTSYMGPMCDADGTKLADIIEQHLVRCVASRGVIREYFHARYARRGFGSKSVRENGETTMPELWFVYIPGLEGQTYKDYGSKVAAEAAAAKFARQRPGDRIYVFQAQWVSSCQTSDVAWRAEPVVPVAPVEPSAPVDR